MADQTVLINGKTYVVIEQEEYNRRLAAACAALPPLPPANAKGNVDAVAYARAAIARKIVNARRAAGMTQTELAQAAGVRVETLNRLENAKHTADVVTLAKIEGALAAGERPSGIAVDNVAGGHHVRKSGGIGRSLVNTGTGKTFVRRATSGSFTSSNRVGGKRSASISEREKIGQKPGVGRRTSKRTPKK